MGSGKELADRLRSPKAEAALKSIYGVREGTLTYEIDRYERIISRHAELYGESGDVRLFSAPGRTEMIGNHTDHNNGCVLAAAINLDTIAAVTPRGDAQVNLVSEGYARPSRITLDDLSPQAHEKGTTAGLIRGVAARMKELGHPIGGFDAAVSSNVAVGSGLSSSAAFEVLVAAIFDGLYGGMSVDPKEKARIAQFSENNYFGKPSGLMDQTASAVGGMVYIDFERPEALVRPLKFDFAAQGYYLVVVNTGGTHADLHDEYAAIPAEMKRVARALGAETLRAVGASQVTENAGALRGQVPDRALLRAFHFFDESQRVQSAANALEKGDLGAFFREIIASGESSWRLLQNIYVGGEQSLALALELSRRLLNGQGAWRIHGGGFAGTILAFVPLNLLDDYLALMNNAFGAGACTVLSVRGPGALELII